MANQIDNTKRLYNNLKADGYDDLGTLDEFRKTVSDRAMSDKLYKNLKEDGYDDLGTTDEFYKKLNPVVAQPTQQPQAPAVQPTAAPQPAVTPQPSDTTQMKDASVAAPAAAPQQGQPMTFDFSAENPSPVQPANEPYKMPLMFKPEITPTNQQWAQAQADVQERLLGEQEPGASTFISMKKAGEAETARLLNRKQFDVKNFDTFFNEHVAPAFGEEKSAAEQQVQSYVDRGRDRTGGLLSKLAGKVRTDYAQEKFNDPEKIASTTLQRVQDDGSFGDYLLSRMGINGAAGEGDGDSPQLSEREKQWMQQLFAKETNEVAKQITDRMYADYQNKSAPESVLGYIGGKAFHENLAAQLYKAMLTRAAGSSGLREQLRAMAYDEYGKDQSWLTRVAGGAAPFAVDALSGAFTLPNYIGQAVVKGGMKLATQEVAKQMEKRAAARGLENATLKAAASGAEDIAQRYIATQAPILNLAIQTAGSAANFATYETQAEIARQIASGEFKPMDIVKEAVHGAALGTAMGAVGGAIGHTARNASTLGKIGAGAAGIGAETGIFALSAGLQKAMQDGVDIEDVDWADTAGEAFGTVIGMKGVGAVMHPRNFLNRYRKSKDYDLQFNQRDLDELKQAGYNFDDVFKGLGKFGEVTPMEGTTISKAKEYTPRPDGTAIKKQTTSEEAWVDADNYEAIMRNPNISTSAKRKLAYIATGKILAPEPMFGVTMDVNDDGKATVTTLNAYGDVIETKDYKSEKAAQAEYDKLQEAARTNTIGGLERIADKAGHPEVVDEAKGRTLNETGIDVDNLEQMAELKEEDANKVMDTYIKNLQEAYMQRFNENLERIGEAARTDTGTSGTASGGVGTEGNVSGTQSGASEAEGAAPMQRTDRRESAYQRGASVADDESSLHTIGQEQRTAEARMMQQMPDGSNTEAIRKNVMQAVEANDLDTAEQLLDQARPYLNNGQIDAMEQYLDAANTQSGIDDAIVQQAAAFEESQRQQLESIADEQGNITQLQLRDGSTVYLVKGDLNNHYSTMIVTDGQGNNSQHLVSEIVHQNQPISIDDALARSVNAYAEGVQHLYSQYANYGLFHDGQQVDMILSGQPVTAVMSGYDQMNNPVFTMQDGSQIALRPEEAQQAVMEAENVKIQQQLAQEAESARLAEQQQRYTNSIKGYAEGQPDLTAPETDTKAAADYLLNQAQGDDRVRKQQITDIDNTRQQLAIRQEEAQRELKTINQWISGNEDIAEPQEMEDAIRRRDELEAVINDIDGRIQKYGEIRRNLMTKEEVQAMEQQRRKEIFNARTGYQPQVPQRELRTNQDGITEENGTPNFGLSSVGNVNNYLLKNYPEVTEAEKFITEQRIKLRDLQRDVIQPAMNERNDKLNAYAAGTIDLTSDEVKQLVHEVADLEAQQDVLSEQAVRLREIAEGIQDLYERNGRNEALTPAEQRAKELEKVNSPEDKLRIARTLYNLYPDALDVINDQEPRELDEFIAANLGLHSMNWEGFDRGGRHINGVQESVFGKNGATRGIGKQYSTNAFNMYLAPTGEGKGFDEVVHDIYEAQPDMGDTKRWTTEDISNALGDLLRSARVPSDISHRIIDNRIAEAEDIVLQQEEYDREMEEMAKMEEMQQWADANHLTPQERETFEEFMKMPPTEIEQEIINKILADEQDQASNGLDSQSANGTVGSEGEGSQGEVRGQSTAAAPAGNQEQPRLEGEQTGNGMAPVSDTDVPGGAQGPVVSYKGIGSRYDELTRVKGLENKSIKNILKDIKAEIEERLADAGVEVEIKDMALHGSRIIGAPREDSDLDVVMEYDGDIKEDALFNILNNEENPIDIGVRVDVNPITKHKTGTLQQYMQRDKAEHQVEYVKTAFDTLQMWYQSLAPVEVVSIESDGNIKNILEEAAGEKTPEGAVEDFRNMLKETKTKALYVPASKKIYIFAENISDGEEEEWFFHENLHRGLEQYYGDGLREIAKAYWDASTSKKSEANKKIISEDYQGMTDEEIMEEYLVHTLSKNMTRGTVDKLINRLSPEHQEIINNILANIGYDREYESEERTEGQHGVVEGAEEAGQTSPLQTRRPGGRGLEERDLTKLSDEELLSDIANFDAEERRLTVDEYDRRHEQELKDETDAYTSMLYTEVPQLELAQEMYDNVWAAFKNGGYATPERTKLLAQMEALEAHIEYLEEVEEERKLAEQAQEEQESEDDFSARLEEAKAETNTNPTEAQKEAGNYRKPELKFGGYTFRIENPKGSVRSGVDVNGKEWSQEMHDTYGYIMEKTGKDGDKMDFFINDDADLDNWNGRVFIIDQKNEDGSFDEHKVMYGYPSLRAAREAYKSNYEDGWWDKHVMQIMGVKKADFDKWLDDSDHKTKPFAEYFRTKVLKDVVKDDVDQLMADVQERKDKESEITTQYGEKQLAKMDLTTLSQLKKKAEADASTSRYLLGTTNVKPGSEKESILKKNIAQAEADIKALSAAQDKLRKQMERNIENAEAGGAMIDHMQDMGIDVNTNIQENRNIRKKGKGDNSEEGKLREMRTSTGSVYGFTYRGKLYLDPRKLNAELPLHEYGHLWAEAFRRLNPEGWKDVVNVMKQDADTWKFVKQLHPEMENEDDIAEEVITTGSGKRGEEKIRAEFERMQQKDPSYKGKWNNIWKNISKAIQDFWKKVGDFLHIKYETPAQVYDQVLKDFANGVNPRKKVEEYLKQRDAEYAEAVKSGDQKKATQIFNEALKENVGNGMTPFVAVDKYRRMQSLAHKIKNGDKAAIEKAAELMTPLIPENAVLIPAPSHKGKATTMLQLANAIAERTGSEVADILESSPRASQYDVKKQGGKAIAAKDMGITVKGQLPDGKVPVVIDNVVDTGNTAEACVKALGTGIVASLADSSEIGKRVATLRSAAPIIANKDGEVVPLSQRFDLSKREVARPTTIENVMDEAEYRQEIADGVEGKKEVQAAIMSEQEQREEDMKKSEAYQRATNAVIKVVSDANVPIKQVSQKEADQMMQLFTMMNKQAITNMARSMRPSPIKRYAVVDMRNPFGVPKYFEKQQYANDFKIWGTNAGGLFVVLDLDKGKTESEKIKQAADIMPDIETWHGSGAVFTKFDHSHMSEGAGSQTFGWGTYLTDSRRIGSDYAKMLNKGWAYQGKHLDDIKPIFDGKHYKSSAIRDILAAMNHGDRFKDAKERSIRFINSEIRDYEEEMKNLSEEDKKDLNDLREILSYVESLEIKDFIKDPENLYKVNIPEDTGDNYLSYMETIKKPLRRKIADAVRNLEGEPHKSVVFVNYKNGWQSLADMIEREQWAYKEILERLEIAFGGTRGVGKKISQMMSDLGFVGVKYPAGTIFGGGDGATNYVIFNEDDAKIVETIQFMFEQPEQPIFVSNALKAVEAIKQEKATPDQWLAMIQKNGGLKAGEDKWIGLSDWLTEQKKAGKSVTKQEVMDYIHENQIQVEEVPYREYFNMDDNPKMIELRNEFKNLEKKYEEEMNTSWRDDENFNQEMDAKYGYGWAYKLNEADQKRFYEITERFNKYNGESPATLAYQEMIDNYGNGFEQGFYVDYGSDTLEPNSDMYDEGISDAAKRFLKLNDQPINDTRLNYTTTGLDNKREIAITVPTIEPYNANDEIHFGDAGEGRAVAWIRFGEAETSDSEAYKAFRQAEKALYDFLDRMEEKYGGNPDDPDTYWEQLTPEEQAEHKNIMQTIRETEAAFDATKGKVLVIDEIQSKRHQDAREKGYKGDINPAVKQDIEKREEEIRQMKIERDSLIDSEWKRRDEIRETDAAKALLNKEGRIDTENIEAWYKLFDDDKVLQELDEKRGALVTRINEAEHELTQVRHQNRIDESHMVPDAPFEKNWHELAMKRMLRYAAENGYDKIAWTTGAQQAERYDLATVVRSIRNSSTIMGAPNWYTLVPQGGAQFRFHVGEDGKIDRVNASGYGELLDHTLSEVFGKDAAPKIEALKDNEVLDFESQTIGGEGMKGFYDEILPRFMNKYGKKWGVKVSEVELPALEGTAQKMWSIDVTPEMKESVMQGQPMFQKGQGGRVYGWTDGKEIFLTPEGMNPNTPIHEYTHIWDKYIQKHDPKLWKDMVATLKKTDMWKQIRENPNYRSIWDDDDRMASEVHSRLSGAQGEEYFVNAAKDNKDSKSIINEVKNVLKRFWNAILRLFGKKPGDSLEAIIRMPLRDLLNKFNPIEGDAEVMPHIVTDKEELARLEKEPTEIGYRNVVANSDGTMGSPMASKLGKKKVKREATTSFEMKKWERSDEHPELATDDGKIDLIKPDGKTVDSVDYNPYIHIRPDKVNSQFKQAWERPNLVYIRTEYPKSELDGEYHAEKAKLSTGKHPWNGGELILSRWDKPIEIVPWEEVANDWEAQFKDKGVHFDIVPPRLLPILVQRGVEILPPHKGMGKACNEAYNSIFGNENKKRQFEIISKTNPMQDDIHTGIRSVVDIKTFDEAYNEAKKEAKAGGYKELAAYPDITNALIEQARNTGEITIYSSKPIEDGVFVTPSKMQAQDYAGDGKVYSAQVPLDFVAWINLDEGQYAEVPEREPVMAGEGIPPYKSLVQGELFTDKDFEPETNTPAESKDDDTFDPTTVRLRKLEEGETCHVERMYKENGIFDFTGSEKVESIDDVAYIFKQLENEAVENTFLALVKDGKPTIIHLAIGNYTAAVAEADPAFAAYFKLQPDEVYFVHNHPSGSLTPSRADYNVMELMKAIFGHRLKPGIIIDTTSGKYGTFADKLPIHSQAESKMPSGAKNEVSYKVYSFSKQVFAKDWNPETAFMAGTPKRVAEFVSSHRLGEHKKMSLIVVNQNWNITGNVFLPWTELKQATTNAAADLIAYYMNQMGGTQVILYGNYEYSNEDKRNISTLNNRLKARNVRMADVVHIDQSARDAGLFVGEPELVSPVARDSGNSELAKAISGKITKAEIEDAMNSKSVKAWLNRNNPKSAPYGMFGGGEEILRELAKARLGITNKYGVTGQVFYNAGDEIASIIEYAREHGLDPAIADKHDFKKGETWHEMVDSDKPIYTDKEVEAILKAVPLKGAEEAFKGALQAFADEKKIREEIEYLKNYDNGNAYTKALALRYIAMKRLREQYEGDERFFRPVAQLKSPDPTRNNMDLTNKPDFELREGETKKTGYRFKKGIQEEILRTIATTPVSDNKLALEDGKNKMYRTNDPVIRGINERYNDQLKSLNANTIFNLGNPAAVLVASGIENKPLRLYGNKLLAKIQRHGYTPEDVRNLPLAVHNPIAIFNGSQPGSFAILTELDIKGDKVLVTLTSGKGGSDVDFNVVSSVYDKKNDSILNWINQQKGLYYNKAKALDYLRHSAPIAETTESKALDSAAKIVKDFKNPSISEENLRKIYANYVDAAEETAEMLGGEKVIFEAEAPEDGKIAWYDPKDGTVHVVLPEHEDVDDIKRSVFHEKLGHEGLVALLGNQAEVNKFGHFVFKSASKKLKQRITEKADVNDPEWKDPLRFSHAAQEVIADIAENGPRTADEFTLWQKIKHYLIKFLNKIGLKVRGLLNDHDLEYYILKTGEALKKWNGMTEEQKQEAAAQGYDKMYSRGKGKPRKRNNESMAQYLQRLREWEKWKIAEQQARDNNDPMPEIDDINNKWEEKYKADLNEWKQRNGITDETPELGAFPKREKGETPQDYAKRVADYETQVDIYKEAPSLFDYLDKANKEYRDAYKAWCERYGMAEAANVDLALYEGDPEGIPHIVDPEDLEAENRADAELAEAVGIDMSTEGAQRHTKLSVIERRKNLESANAEDAVWIHNIVQSINLEAERQGISPKELRKNLADIIEGTYFEEVVRDENGDVIAINDVSDQKPIKMTTGLKDILDTIKDWYDYFYHDIEDAGLRNDAGYIPEGYVNHVWSREKSNPEAWKKYVENFQRTKSPNMKERIFDTYREGEEVGLVRKFDDIADILAYYSSSNNQAIANKKFLDALSFVVVEELNSDGEVVSVMPLLNSGKPNAMIADRYDMYKVPGVGDVWVIKDIQRTFANIFGTMRTKDVPEWITKTGKVYDTTSSIAKKIQLSFSAFHMGALTEVALAQMRPDRALRALGQYIILDCAKAGTIPAYAHPEDFKFAASHLVQLGATQDYSAADVNNVTEKIREIVRELANEENLAKKGAGIAATPIAAALDYINKGMDKVLWNYLHDGLKIACFKMFAEQIDKRVVKEGLTPEKREELLDEAGQYVNDTFGGQYWELLNVSPSLVKWLRRAFLSPDWLISTQRHFLANFGFGSLYSESGFLNYLKYNRDNIKRAFGVDVPRDENRRFRSKSAKICYLIGVLGFFYPMMNAINAFFRAQDEDEEKKKADEMRKTNPNYKSPYELAYPDGMKWYDYTMYGNVLGQQTHLFLGRYDDGTEWYARWGKQFREFPELFMGRHGFEFPTPLLERMSGKANPIGRYLMYDVPLTVGMYGYRQPRETQEIADKYGNTVALLAMTAKKFLPFSVPTQQDKEFKMFDLVMPSQKGFTQWKALDFFKTYIEAGDMDGVLRTYNAAVMNNLDAEAALKAAISSIKATQRKELTDGVTDLQTAMERFDAATGEQERKLMKRRILQYLAEQNYKAYTRDEAKTQVENFLNGEPEQQNDDINYNKLQTSADVRDDYRLNTIKKKAKKYVDEMMDATGDHQKALIKGYRHWFQIQAIIRESNKATSKLKKQLGKGNDDAELMKQIRDIRTQTQKKVDEVEAPK